MGGQSARVSKHSAAGRVGGGEAGGAGGGGGGGEGKRQGRRVRGRQGRRVSGRSGVCILKQEPTNRRVVGKNHVFINFRLLDHKKIEFRCLKRPQKIPRSK